MNRARFHVFTFAPALCGLVAFVVYYTTLAPTIAWGNFPNDALHIARIGPQTILSEDSAELAGAAATLGVAHPSGYPLFILLGYLFTRLPLGDEAAYRTNLFSAVCAAAAVALLWLIVHALTERPRAAWLAALLFAFSYTFWEHALMTEVHALHLLLLLLALWCALRAVRTNERRWLYAWAFLSGLGMTNHLTTILFLPGFLVLLFQPLRQTLRDGRATAALLGCCAAGLLPYLYLPIRAAQDPPYNWGNPTNLARLWALVSGAEYRYYLSCDGAQFLQELLRFPLRLMVEFGYVPTALGVLGWGGWLGFWWRERTRKPGTTRRPFAPSSRGENTRPGVPERAQPHSPPTGQTLTAFALMGTAQLAFILCYHIPDPQALYIPAFFVFATGIGVGWAVMERGLDRAGKVWRDGFSVVLIGLIVTPLLQEEPHVHGFLSALEEFLPPRMQGLLLQHPRVSLRHHYMAARYARGVLNALPNNAIFLSRGDGRTFAVWYEQHVRRRRPDVVTVLYPLLRYEWYRRQVAERLRLPALAALPDKASIESILDLLTEAPHTAHRSLFFNQLPRDWQDMSHVVPFSISLPGVHPADKVTGDQDTIYAYAPRGAAGREVQLSGTAEDGRLPP